MSQTNAAMTVLSCFDGISAGQEALKRAEIEVDYYFASEIDKYAIKITQANFPKTKQLGDIQKIDLKALPRIDLLLGGSPCTGFSRAGKRLSFEDPQSKLFFDFVKIKNELNPKYFLFENVIMSQEEEDVITEALGVKPIQINSALLSAQNRNRLYFTNIPYLFHPIDRNIFLKDILESGNTERFQSFCIDANYHKGGSLKNYLEKSRRQLVLKDKSNCLRVGGRNSPFGSRQNWDSIYQLNTDKSSGGKQPKMQDRVYDVSGKAPCLTSFAGRTKISDPIMYLKPRGNNPGGIRAEDGKSNTVSANSWEQNNFVSMSQSEKRLMVKEAELMFRKLSVTEVERLQTFQDGYTNHVSNSQRYKCLGNSWTVEVIVHLLQGLKWA